MGGKTKGENRTVLIDGVSYDERPPGSLFFFSLVLGQSYPESRGMESVVDCARNINGPTYRLVEISRRCQPDTGGLLFRLINITGCFLYGWMLIVSC